MKWVKVQEIKTSKNVNNNSKINPIEFSINKI